MDDKVSKARTAIKDRVVGKVKELTGAIFGSDSLVAEGQLRQERAEAVRAASAEQAIAERERQVADEQYRDKHAKVAATAARATAETARERAVVEVERERAAQQVQQEVAAEQQQKVRKIESDETRRLTEAELRARVTEAKTAAERKKAERELDAALQQADELERAAKRARSANK